MSDPKNGESKPQLHPFDAVVKVHQEFEKIARFVDAAHTLHNVNLESITKSFQTCDDLLGGLKKYHLEKLKEQNVVNESKKADQATIKPKTR